jgi:copper homeostasis protein
MLLELCAYSAPACRQARLHGVDRIELCAGRAEGGLTPSAGLLTLARHQTDLPLFVMIRPRGGDFCYDSDERAVILADIKAAKNAGADGLVFGALRPDGTVDADTLRPLLDAARPLPVTFHRAFDLTRNPAEALDALIGLGIPTVLTSGQQPTAEAGLPLLRALVGHANGRIGIMAGSGITALNAGLFAGLGLAAVHLTAKQTQPGPMQFRRPDLLMNNAGPADEYARIVVDWAGLRAVSGQIRGQ